MNIKLRIAALVCGVTLAVACGDVPDDKEWEVVGKSRSTHAQTREVTYFVQCRVKGGTEEKRVTVSKIRWEDVENGQRCPGS